MSATYGEGSPSEYDFSLEKASQIPYYDPDRIAKEAVWPAVDHLWGGDWRTEAYIGHDFTFPGRGAGLHENTIFDVSVNADCFGVASEDSSNIELEHSVIVQIEKNATPMQRSMVFYHANEADPETMEALDSYQNLVAKIGTTYSFDTRDSEDAEVNGFQSIEDNEGNIIWVSDKIDEHEVEMMADEGDYGEILFDTDRFHWHDIENIATALSILGAPEQYLRALSIIKGQPIEAADE